MGDAFDNCWAVELCASFALSKPAEARGRSVHEDYEILVLGKPIRFPLMVRIASFASVATKLPPTCTVGFRLAFHSRYCMYCITGAPFLYFVWESSFCSFVYVPCLSRAGVNRAVIFSCASRLCSSALS